MDDEFDAHSAAMTKLLGKQLANITDTLAKASQRRNLELERRMALKPQVAPVVQVPPATSYPKLSPISGAETSPNSTSGSGGFVFGGRQLEPNMQACGRYDLGLSQADTIMGWIHDIPKMHVPSSANQLTEEHIPQCALRGGCAKNDADPKEMLAYLDSADSTPRDDDIDARELIAGLSKTEPTIDTGTVEDWKMELSQMLWDVAPLSSPDYSKRPEFGSAPPGDQIIVSEQCEDMESKLLRKALDRSLSMSTDAEAEAPVSILREDNDDSLEALRSKLMKSCSPEPIRLSPVPEPASVRAVGIDDSSAVKDVALEKNLIPFIVALQLESKGLPWEKLRGWTTYLFSNGLDGYKACQEKDAIVEQAAEELKQTIQQVQEEDNHYQSIQNKAMLSRRLIVSNIAAGAEVEDVKEFFSSFSFAIRELVLLPGHDPVKRTKIAHLNMASREYAMQASYMMGSIFGLFLTIRLAVEEQD